MRKQISGMGLVILAAMALIALNVVYVAGRQLVAPGLPVIQSSSPVTSKDVETAEVPESSFIGSETQYSAVVINPATGQAEAVEYSAPRLRSRDADVGFAGGEGDGQYSAVVINPATGRAEAVEYSAPRLSSLEAEVGFAGGEGDGRYSAVVINPATGAEVIEWNAPRVSSLSTGTEAEGLTKFSAVIINPTSGAELVEWVAQRLSSAETAGTFDPFEETQYSTVVVNSATGKAEVVEWRAPRVK